MTQDGSVPGSDDRSQARGLTRRNMLRWGVVAAGAAAATPLLTEIAAGAAGASTAATYPGAPAGSTLARTLPHGTPGPSGYRPIVTGAGEPSLPRLDLLAGSTRHAATRTPLLAFTQLTDMHIVDAQSPARVEFLDRYNDPGNPLAGVAPFAAAYRPWEMLSAQVAEAMVQAVNALAGGPVTGRPIDFTISTGDNSDNTQYNEVRWHIDLLDGKQVIVPDSGSLNRWEGVGGPSDLDTAYWHPDGTPPLGSADNYRARYGYPTVPGLLDRCRARFASTGLHTPWYSVYGNHDGLVVGNVPPNPALNSVATGSIKVIGLPSGVDLASVVARLRAGDPSVLAQLIADGPVRRVTPDPNRRLLSRAQNVHEHFLTTGRPVGHGYTSTNVAQGTAYYTFTRGPVTAIVLDTVNPNGYDDGSLDATQYAWLQAQLSAASSRQLDSSGNWVAGTGTDRLVLIFSHHTVATMENTLGVHRVDGTAVAQLLLQYPNVIAWVNGHTHVNSVAPHARTSGAAAGSGFWEINTASHVDWPQQSRVIELVNNGDATLSVFTTIVDHAAPASWPANPTTPLQLAALSRELAVNDPQRPAETAATDGRRGTVADRNLELLVAAPFQLIGAGGA